MQIQCSQMIKQVNKHQPIPDPGGAATIGEAGAGKLCPGNLGITSACHFEQREESLPIGAIDFSLRSK